MASISELISYEIEYEGYDVVITAEAIIEDAVIHLHQTWFSPEEYAPARCWTKYTLYDYEEEQPLDEEKVCSLLEEYAEWTVCEE